LPEHGFHFAGGEDGGEGGSDHFPVIAIQVRQLIPPQLKTKYILNKEKNLIDTLDLFRGRV
jgi:hypothetical protein